MDVPQTGWTPETVLYHLSEMATAHAAMAHAVRQARDAHLDERFGTQTRDLLAALESMNERLAAMNEIRGSLADANARNLPRSEANVRFKPLEESEAAGRGAFQARTGLRLDSSWLLSLAALALATYVALGR